MAESSTPKINGKNEAWDARLINGKLQLYNIVHSPRILQDPVKQSWPHKSPIASCGSLVMAATALGLNDPKDEMPMEIPMLGPAALPALTCG